MTTRIARFPRSGHFMIEASAVGQMFELPELALSAFELVGGTAIVRVRGPLMHHDALGFDSYDAIRCRVQEALESEATAVLLSFDSPGGLVNGCFETASALKSMSAAAGKPLLAYVDGQCCSAAYALACVCSKIVCSPTALVGSIGVLDCLLDGTAADRAMGLRFSVVASGSHKLDGNPHVALSDEALAASTRRVDELAAFFFRFVADNRQGLEASDLDALQADVLVGQAALDAGLVDEIGMLDDMLVALSATGNAPTSASNAAPAPDSRVTPEGGNTAPAGSTGAGERSVLPARAGREVGGSTAPGARSRAVASEHSKRELDRLAKQHAKRVHAERATRRALRTQAAEHRFRAEQPEYYAKMAAAAVRRRAWSASGARDEHIQELKEVNDLRALYALAPI